MWFLCLSSAYSASFFQPSRPPYQRRRVATLSTLAQVQVIFVHGFDYTPICSVSMATLCSPSVLVFIAPISDRCKLALNANCILSACRQNSFLLQLMHTCLGGSICVNLKHAGNYQHDSLRLYSSSSVARTCLFACM